VSSGYSPTLALLDAETVGDLLGALGTKNAIS